MATRRAAQQMLTGFRRMASDAKNNSIMTHEELVHGKVHHGLRPGYSYDWEHGPHYIDCRKIPNFRTKYQIFMPLMFAVAIGIPGLAVWWQQSKLKTA